MFVIIAVKLLLQAYPSVVLMINLVNQVVRLSFCVMLLSLVSTPYVAPAIVIKLHLATRTERRQYIKIKQLQH